MPDKHQQPPRPPRAVPPPFAGPPRAGALSPQTRTDRPTLPPFSPPFVKRATPPVTPPPPPTAAAPRSAPLPEPVAAPESPWFDGPNEVSEASQPSSVAGVTWVNPDKPVVPAPPQAATGIAWLDSPAPESPAGATPAAAPDEDDDVFGWDPAEERGTSLDAPPTPQSLDALKELEPWALPGSEMPSTSADEVADVLDRIAGRIRSGDLIVPGASSATSDEALLACVLAALLQRARG